MEGGGGGGTVAPYVLGWRNSFHSCQNLSVFLIECSPFDKKSKPLDTRHRQDSELAGIGHAEKARPQQGQLRPPGGKQHQKPKHVRLQLPPAPPRRHTMAVDCSIRQAHLRRIGQDPEGSVMRSISTFNNKMAVTESILGKSVVPRKRKKLMKNPIRILCLDGGGVKVSFYLFPAQAPPSLVYHRLFPLIAGVNPNRDSACH